MDLDPQQASRLLSVEPALLRTLSFLDSRSLRWAAEATSLLRKAAAAARSNIQTKIHNETVLESLQLYLTRHGQHVTALQLAAERSSEEPLSLQELPGSCSNLQELSLQGFKSLQLSASSSHSGVLRACTGLTRLVISDCKLSPAAAGDDAAAADTRDSISALTELQHLRLCRIGQGQLSASFLTSLQKLTRLETVYALDEASTLQHVSALGQLQFLQMQLEQGTSSAAALSGLGQLQQLTELRLGSADDWQGNLKFAHDAMPFVSRLTGLQALVLPKGSTLNASILSGFSQLRVLGVCDVNITPGFAALMSQLTGLQQLCDLSLSVTSSLTPPSPSAAAYRVLAALAAGSWLKRLHLEFLQQLPVYAWQALFPADRQLTQLTSLRLVEKTPHTFDDDYWVGGPSTLNSTVVSRMCRCCPNLQELWLDWGSQHTRRDFFPDLSCLEALTTLTQLWLSNVSNDAVSSIAQLTRLKKLSLMPPNKLLSTVAVAGLVDLEQLDSLTVLEKEQPQVVVIRIPEKVGWWVQTHPWVNGVTC